jgi:hypothetical protein
MDISESMFPDTGKTITTLLCSLLAACGGGSGGDNGTAGQPPSSLSTSTGEPSSPIGRGVNTPAAPTGDAAAGNTVIPTREVGKAAPGVTIPLADGVPPSLTVTAPPASMGLDPYYQKYLNADGISVLAAAGVDDQALIKVKQIIDTKLSKRKDIRDALVAASGRCLGRSLA